MLQLDLYLLNLLAAKNNKLTTCKYLTSNFEEIKKLTLFPGKP
jgi:hypothetical protein